MLLEKSWVKVLDGLSFFKKKKEGGREGKSRVILWGEVLFLLSGMFPLSYHEFLWNTTLEIINIGGKAVESTFSLICQTQN